jgi:hypothetical protein
VVVVSVVFTLESPQPSGAAPVFQEESAKPVDAHELDGAVVGKRYDQVAPSFTSVVGVLVVEPLATVTLWVVVAVAPLSSVTDNVTV